MRRRLFNVLTGASLLLCLAFLAIGIQSHWRNTTAWFDLPASWKQWVMVRSEYGKVSVSYYNNDIILFRSPQWFRHESHPIDWQLRTTSIHWWRYGGFYLSRTALWYIVSVPYWFLVLLFAVLPALWTYRWRRMHRILIEGKCRTCGYDLRASPERCPECGTVVED